LDPRSVSCSRERRCGGCEGIRHHVILRLGDQGQVGHMPKMTKPWDYLIVTAANDRQAKAYDFQIRQRQEAGEIPQVRNCLVITDTDGRRIGSGGSTLHCLWSVLERERPSAGPGSFEEAEAILSDLRILIVHAGGDSRRL